MRTVRFKRYAHNEEDVNKNRVGDKEKGLKNRIKAPIEDKADGFNAILKASWECIQVRVICSFFHFFFDDFDALQV